MGIFDSIDWDGIRKEQEEWRGQARRELLPGIDPAELVPGMRVTISPNLRLGDRSYTDAIHTVLAVNSSHVQTRLDGRPKPVLLMVHEHHFYSAAGFEAPADDQSKSVA